MSRKLTDADISEIRIVRGFVGEVEDAINRLLAEGWSLRGAMISTSSGNGLSTVAQQLVKYKQYVKSK